MTLIVGLTGGIASGKSTVSASFQQLGVPIVDTDLLAHQLTQKNGTAIPALRTLFGDAYIQEDGALDRTKLRELIFTHPIAKQQLEQLLHPQILALAQQQFSQYQSAAYILFVVPLLLQAPSFQSCVNRILVVHCDPDTRLHRLCERGLTPELAHAIMRQQSSPNDLQAAADDLLDNNGSLPELQKQIEQLHQRYSTIHKN